MQESIRNRSGESTTRLEVVKAALSEVGDQIRDELRSLSAGTAHAFQGFVYAFGLRIGKGVADMASLWKVSQRLNLKQEVEVRKQRYEAEMRQKAESYSGLASLARNFGYGSFVDAATSAAANSIRANIIADVAQVVLAEAERIGDTTLTAEGLTEIFDQGSVASDDRLLDHILFGLTPMTEAAKQLRDRFYRVNPEEFDYRTLLIVSDGMPTDGDPREPLRQLRESGVNVIACFVTSDDIADPRVLHGAPVASWTEGARLMWDIASPIDEAGPAARFLFPMAGQSNQTPSFSCR